MAKKQGLQSIMGQADTTLVNAAYRMGMANVPKDLSGIHNKIGDSYAAGMKQLGAGFGALAGAAINKGIELSQKAKEDKDTDSLDEVEDSSDEDEESDEDDEVKKVELKEEVKEYSSMKVSELKKLAAGKGLTGYTKLNKAGLVNLLENN